MDADIQAPELLQELFLQGSSLLLGSLPDVFQGRGPQMATPQDAQQATPAAKVRQCGAAPRCAPLDLSSSKGCVRGCS